MNFVEFDNMVSSVTDGAASASECHGHLIGLLCVDPNQVVDRWFASLLSLSSDKQFVGVSGESELKELASKLVKLVADGDLEYQLLLPDDDESLSHRVGALAQWCQGYLFGLAEAGIQRFDGLPGDCAEILADISELTNADSHEDGEESEQDYFELTEYVKVGTQLIFEELSLLSQPNQTSH